MPRAARVVLPGIPHHITQRGSRRFDIFRDDGDRLDYLVSFRSTCREQRLRILAYCLMTNHVHYVAIPEQPDSIRRVFHRVHGMYAQRFNRKYKLVGHLWQERPFSCVLEGAHLWNAIRYVEQNPVRARIVVRASDYRWSSAAAHCGGESDALLDLDFDGASAIRNWAAWLESEDAGANQIVRDCTSVGRPCGGEAFVKVVEQESNRDFSRKKPGPKPKPKADDGLLLDFLS